ncbi:hypothetical protein BDV40DRAFT_299127 [Aspergillus tamarii]|uniref:Ankyrin repeat-containing domain protein n=1 Tax=Aspergillus tamarii TaxID=41984 RepID=A0A5N6UYR2_ASPTM|nr:hypothetical protein BDV40DRAFT_299127 [Aspergillus tamarii]
MTSIHILARQGTLTASQLDEYRIREPEIIDSVSNGLTPLIEAVLQSRIDTIKLLLRYGANVDAVDANGRTALSVAAEKVWRNQPAVIGTLLNATPKPKVDATCEAVHGNTPLMLVIQQSRNLDVIRQLVDAGASLIAENRPPIQEKSIRKKREAGRGRTVSQLAEATKDPDVIYTLRKNAGGVGLADVVTMIMNVVLFILELLNHPLENGHRLLNEWFGGWNPRVPARRVQECIGSNPEQDHSSHAPTPDVAVPGVSSDTAPGPCPEQEQILLPPAGNDNPPDIPTESSSNLSPEQLTQLETDKKFEEIKAHVTKAKLNEYFSLEDDNFLPTIAEKAVRLRQDGSTLLGNKTNLPKMIDLAMFKPVIYCDDSGSMRHSEPGSDGTRFDRLISVVQRVARVTTKLVPDDMGIDLRFINYTESHDNLREEEDIRHVMERIGPCGRTLLGTGLETKILKPMIYDVLEKGERLERPVLVTIITDGCPTDKKQNKFQTVIKECKSRLEENEYPEYGGIPESSPLGILLSITDAAAVFQISQVGSDNDATEFLNMLMNGNEEKDLVYCTSEHLDTMYEKMRDNEKGLEVWLLEHLMGPILRWGEKDFVHPP